MNDCIERELKRREREATVRDIEINWERHGYVMKNVEGGDLTEKEVLFVKIIQHCIL